MIFHVIANFFVLSCGMDLETKPNALIQMARDIQIRGNFGHNSKLRNATGYTLMETEFIFTNIQRKDSQVSHGECTYGAPGQGPLLPQGRILCDESNCIEAFGSNRTRRAYAIERTGAQQISSIIALGLHCEVNAVILVNNVESINVFRVGDLKPYKMALVLVPKSAGSAIQAAIGEQLSIVENAESRFLLNFFCLALLALINM